MALALLALAGTAQADVAGRVTASAGLSFGSYEVDAGSPNDSLADLTVTCDRNGGPQDVTLVVRLGPGLNAGTTTERRMVRAGLPPDFLAYGLYRNVGRTSAWGSTDNVDTVSQTLSIPNKDSRSAAFTIYGRVPAGQDVSAGTYSDTVQITILY